MPFGIASGSVLLISLAALVGGWYVIVRYMNALHEKLLGSGQQDPYRKLYPGLGVLQYTIGFWLFSAFINYVPDSATPRTIGGLLTYAIPLGYRFPYAMCIYAILAVCCVALSVIVCKCGIRNELRKATSGTKHNEPQDDPHWKP